MTVNVALIGADDLFVTPGESATCQLSIGNTSTIVEQFTVLALGESLGIPVLAEGIETQAQWQFLAQAGCAKGQGYLFAKPVGLAQLPAACRQILSDSRSRPSRSQPRSARP